MNQIRKLAKIFLHPFSVYLLLSLIFLCPILFKAGLPFKYDWSWPLFDLGDFWRSTFKFDGSFLSIFYKNLIFIFGLFGFLHLPPALFLKIFLLAVHLAAGYGFYRFLARRTLPAVALIGGVAYAFSPYIFIRTIIGFTAALAAYAALPWFLDLYLAWPDKQQRAKIGRLLAVGFLFSIVFAQGQSGLLLSLILFIHLLISPLFGRFRTNLKSFLLAYLSLGLFELSWIIQILLSPQKAEVISGSAATTLGFIAGLPHSLRNVLLMSDHHITQLFFYSLARDPAYFSLYTIFFLTAALSLFDRKNRQLIFALILSGLIVLPFSIGPTGIFAGFYTRVFNHFPLIAVFRETYHFEFLIAVSAIALFSLGLGVLWRQLNKGGLAQLMIKTIAAGSLLAVIAPYLTFDYAGYLKLQKIPSEYNQLNQFLKNNKNYCSKIFYPPGLGFIYFKSDPTDAASNSDVVAASIGAPYLNDGASVLNLPSEEMFYRNEVVSQFYEESDDGRFAALLAEGDIDCVILRLDTESKYHFVSNLWQEQDRAILLKWNETDLLALAKSKQGLELTKQFGEKIYIFKLKVESEKLSAKGGSASGGKVESIDNSVMKQFNNLTIQQLPLTDWATDYDYFHNGWSRGRYAFWRKHLFAELRQDFIYTDKPQAALTGKIEADGSYELWTRYLTGGTFGNFQFSIFNFQFTIIKDMGPERFIWRDLGRVELSGRSDIEIKNLSGENAIADLVLVKQ